MNTKNRLFNNYTVKSPKYTGRTINIEHEQRVNAYNLDEHLNMLITKYNNKEISELDYIDKLKDLLVGSNNQEIDMNKFKFLYESYQSGKITKIEYISLLKQIFDYIEPTILKWAGGVNLTSYIGQNNYLTNSNEAKNLAIRLNTYFDNKNLNKFMKHRQLFIGSFHGKEKTYHDYFSLLPGEQVIMNCVKFVIPSMGSPRAELFYKLLDKRTTKYSFMKWVIEKSKLNSTNFVYYKQMCVFDDKIPNVSLYYPATLDDPMELTIEGKNPQGIFKVPFKFSKDKKKLISFKAFTKIKGNDRIDLHQIIKLLRKHKYKEFTLYITFCR
jgi:hypothetical protein